MRNELWGNVRVLVGDCLFLFFFLMGVCDVIFLYFDDDDDDDVIFCIMYIFF